MQIRDLSRWILGLALLGAGISGGADLVQDEKPVLASGQNFEMLERRFSIGEQVFTKGFCDSGMANWLVLDLGGRFGSFSGYLGMLDDWSAKEGTYSLKVDGKEVKSGSVRRGQAPLRVAIDLRGAKSMRIQMNYCACADWVFSKSPPEDPGPAPLAPDEDVKWPRKAQMFVWRSPPEALSYALEIVAMQLDEAASSSAPRVWCYASPEPRLQVDLSTFPAGEYRWSVLAFDDRKMIGKRGLSRRFILTK